MRYATIDIGTNSMRLLLSEISGNTFLDRKKYVNTTRLGKGIDESGIISDDSIRSNIDALKEFAEISKDYACEQVMCMGTAALRNAKNSDVFVKEAKRETGIDVDIISGEKEAILGYTGVVGGIDIKDEAVLIIDIGGGSTEFIIGDKTKIFYRRSLDLGALLLTEKLVSSMPESDQELKIIKNYIENNVSSVVMDIKHMFESGKLSEKFDFKQLKLIGIGGTITSVSAINQNLEVYSMEKVHSSIVKYSELENQIENIKSMNLNQRRNIVGLQKKRAEIILSGEMILESIMRNLCLKSIQISEYDNLEGLVLKDIQSKIESR
ncbi:MAG: Ppx/GppA phosphatase family protein [Peptostreptococcus sp.]|uniref:Ppx/GppA phosphatase family protein n=1 Tax=Peptostreptococcus sp. TaxID=1262 RepID=UPI002FC5A4C1